MAYFFNKKFFIFFLSLLGVILSGCSSNTLRFETDGVNIDYSKNDFESSNLLSYPQEDKIQNSNLSSLDVLNSKKEEKIEKNLEKDEKEEQKIQLAFKKDNQLESSRMDKKIEKEPTIRETKSDLNSKDTDSLETNNKKEFQKPNSEALNKKKSSKTLDTDDSSSKDLTFIYPLQGTILNQFNETIDGQKNNGIDIKVKENTDVKASAAGTVIYAGDGLNNLGNTVLIKHDLNFITVYSHNNLLLVKKDDKIIQGQIIAKSGCTGNVKEPQLHFEIRQGPTPVDPELYLNRH